MVTNTGIAIHIDGIKHKVKPSFGLSNLSKTKSHVREVTPQELLNICTNGMTVCLAEFSTPYPWEEGAEFVQQQYFMLDFDNGEKVDIGNGTSQYVKYTGDKYMSLEDAMNHPFVKENALFIYSTFSNNKAEYEYADRYRVAFKLDIPITDEQEVLKVNTALLGVFPYADANCSAVKRVVYGGGGNHTIINLNNELSYKSLNTASIELKSERVKKANSKRSNVVKQDYTYSPNEIVSFIANGEISELRDRLKLKPTVYPNIHVAKQQIKKVNMGTIFGLPVDEEILDIFHTETKPSARIYENADGYIYVCFSSSHEFTGDIFNVVQEIRGCDYIEAFEFLLAMLNITIQVSEEVQIIHNQLDMFLSIMRDVKLMEKEFPMMKKVFQHGRNRQLCINIIQLFRDYVFIDFNTGKQMVATTLSEESISFMLSANRYTVHDALIKLRMVGIIKSLKDEEIPNHVLVSMKQSQLRRSVESGHYQNRTTMHSCTIETTKVSFINFNCSEYKNKRMNNLGMSETAIAVAFGEEQAKDVYVQSKRKQEAYSGETKKHLDSLVKYAHKAIEKQGYACDAELKGKFGQGYKFSKGKTNNIFLQLRGGMINYGNLKAVPNNKEERAKYGIDKKMQGGVFYVKGDE